jgi:hypothetical protein
MPACRGISISDLYLLLYDGGVATTGPVLARCGTETLPCPVANITFEFPENQPINANMISGVGVNIDAVAINGNSLSISVSGAKTGAYIPLPVPKQQHTSDNVLVLAIILPISIISIIVLTVYRMKRLQ